MTKPAKAVNPNHIFVDTRSTYGRLQGKNVLIGGYSGDPRFQKDAACLHYLYSLNGKKLYISTLSVAQLISVYQKKKTNDEIRRIVRELRHRFNVIDFTARDIDEALNETGADVPYLVLVDVHEELKELPARQELRHRRRGQHVADILRCKWPFDPVHFHAELAAVPFDVPVYTVEKRGLACAVSAKQAVDLAALKGEIYVLQDQIILITFGEMLDYKFHFLLRDHH